MTYYPLSLSGWGSLALLFPVFLVSPLALSVLFWLHLLFAFGCRRVALEKMGVCFLCCRSDAGRCVTERHWRRCRCETGDIQEMHMIWQVRERRHCGDDLQVSVVLSVVIAAAAVATARIPVGFFSLPHLWAW
ncbi:hypothetical protein B0T18DRAFT_31024 [Schizothecium vesticola]|uniref:Uncharacterized protein n=1 Tax=Schizothecium vesticola TaxID=314040 RepID=A0AA40FA98_9PEZI|nr:hypothetical protein B0T18DRAFT_31024 [Schizothecium vesticola]